MLSLSGGNQQKVVTRSRCCCTQIPSRHHIGEGVVVNVVMIFVGSDDMANVRRPVGIALDSGRPIA